MFIVELKSHILFIFFFLILIPAIYSLNYISEFNVILKERLLENRSRFTIKMQKLRGNVNFLLSFFKIMGIWIKIKFKKIYNMFIRTKDAKNDRKLMTCIFGGDIKPISYIVPLMKSSSKKSSCSFILYDYSC